MRGPQVRYASPFRSILIYPLNHQKTCKLEFPVHVALTATHLDTATTTNLAQQIQQGLDRQNKSPIHRLRVITLGHGTADRSADAQYTDPSSSSAVSSQVAATVDLVLDDSYAHPVAKVQPFDPTLSIYHGSLSSSQPTSVSDLADFITTELLKLFVEEQITLDYLLNGQTSHQESLGDIDASSIIENYRKRSNRAFKYASTYHLTFSLFTGSASPSAWDIKAALDEYLSPFLASFSSVSKFSVDTQVQLYASLSSSLHGPQYDDTSKQHTLMRSDLSAFINAAEWPLSPSIGVGPTINFVAYVPSPKQAPMVIEETGGTSWLIPQWGGVQILNPDMSQNNTVLNKHDLEPVVRIFAEQLESLIGLPQSPPSLPLRLSSLTRERAASLILSASSTLGALSRLTLKLTSIAIPDNVADSVQKTIHHLETACSHLHEGHYDAALEHARIAEAQAEQAFFEPSMVGQVYFPDEHKVAVYVPLLGPMAVPLVMAALKEFKKFKQARAKTG
jgi:phosphatidylinositol glycan class S